MANGNTDDSSWPHHPSDINAQWEPRTSHRDHYSDHMNGHLDTNGSLTPASSFTSSPISPPSIDPQRSPSSIALRSHLLGFTLGAAALLTIHLIIYERSPLWRLPFFLSALSIFHSLEFYVTARHNPPAATLSAFLLDNGRAYNIAHLCAFSECFLHFQPFLPAPEYLFPQTDAAPWVALGLGFMIVGQTIRTAAMAQAGTNFNHVVQSFRKENHVLVTDGVYRFTRHPAYLGFFWWGLGTQVVLGNVVCLVGYAVVLWRFFKKRIDSKFKPNSSPHDGADMLTPLFTTVEEEEYLIRFFGQDYVKYKQQTGVGIPFISQ